MNKIFNFIRSLCISLFGIYSINLLFSSINLYIPINLYSLSIISYLGFFGIASFIFISLLL